jgi:hypothetical protein
MGCPISKAEPSLVGNLVCSPCREQLFNIDSFREARQSRVSYTTSWKDIQEANQKGCGWCDMVFSEVNIALRTMRDPDQTQYQGTIESIKAIADLLCQEKIIVVVKFREEEDGQLLLTVRYDSTYNDSAGAMSCVAISTPSGMITGRTVIIELR